MLDNMKVEYDNELKIKCDCHLFLSGTHGCTPHNISKHCASYTCNKRPCKGGFSYWKKSNPDTSKTSYMLRKIKKHTCNNDDDCTNHGENTN